MTPASAASSTRSARRASEKTALNTGPSSTTGSATQAAPSPSRFGTSTPRSRPSFAMVTLRLTRMGCAEHEVDALLTVEVCAWCPDSKARTDEATAKGFSVSHGCCKACAEKVVTS